jgi:hypothetical protein
MNWLSTLFAGGASSMLDSTTGLVKSIYTSPGEKISREEALQRVQNAILTKQQEVDKIQIQANGIRKDPCWKNTLAWVGVGGIFYKVLGRPIYMGLTSHPHVLPDVDIDVLITLVSGMLGMSTLHLFDKLKSK